MTRLGVLRMRLAATLGVLLLIYAVVRLLWYPGAYFEISGTGRLLAVLAAVTLIVGPGLSAFVYKPGKKGLKVDLALLAGVEFLAVAVAVSLIYVRQPYFTVFAVDRFEAVSWQEVDATQIRYAELRRRPGHAPRLVYAELPADPEVFDRLMDETIFEGKKDIDRRPEFWLPYSAGIPAVAAAAQPLESLLQGDSERAASVKRWMQHRDAKNGEYVFLPLRGKHDDALMILHASIGFPVDSLNVDPW